MGTYVEDARRARALYARVLVHARGVPSTLRRGGAKDAVAEAAQGGVRGPDVRQLWRDLPRLLRVLVLGAVRGAVLALGGGIARVGGGARGNRGWGCWGGVIVCTTSKNYVPK